MEIRHLRTFLTVAETLNVSAAARRLSVTQPALSRHIQALEHFVGHSLFVRQPQGLQLTPTGLVLQAEGTKALASFEAALHHARDAGAPASRVVRFGYYGISIWERLLAPAIEAFGRRHPLATLNMFEESSSHLADGLRDGRLDVALLGSGDYTRIPGVVTELACRVPAMAVLAANHPLAKRRAIALEDLRDQTIVGFNQQDAPGRDRTFVAACRESGFTPKICYVASVFPEICTAVRKTTGVAILSAFAETVPHPGVVFVKLKPPGVLLDVYVSRTASGSPEAVELADLIIGQAQRASGTFEVRLQPAA